MADGGEPTPPASNVGTMDRQWLRETAALVALLRAAKQSKASWASIAAEVEEHQSAVAVLEETVTQGSLVSASEVDPGEIEQEVVAWLDEGMSILTVLDQGYPSNLRTVHEMPPLLFARGELIPQDDRAIAVVGSRQASEEGLDRASQIAAELVGRGYTVASGLAKGIDAAAHRGALEADGRTIAVIGTGLRRSYPAENVELQARLARETAVLSQFWPDQPPTKWTFPWRNAVMSGLTNATVVVEAAERSGARMQARLAFEHGRPVFLPRQLVDSQDWARKYAKDNPNAHVVEEPGEIADRIDRLLAVEELIA